MEGWGMKSNLIMEIKNTHDSNKHKMPIWRNRINSNELLRIAARMKMKTNFFFTALQPNNSKLRKYVWTSYVSLFFCHKTVVRKLQLHLKVPNGDIQRFDKWQHKMLTLTEFLLMDNDMKNLNNCHLFSLCILISISAIKKKKRPREVSYPGVMTITFKRLLLWLAAPRPGACLGRRWPLVGAWLA